MNIIRSSWAVAAAFSLALTAGGAVAQNVKYFQLGAPASTGVTSTTIQLTFKNIETGNSSFNSLGIKGIGAGGAAVTIAGATASSPFGPGTPLVTGDGYFYLTGLSPVKKGQTVTVTLTVQFTGSGCTNGSIAWQGRAFTGSPSQPSTEFQQTNANPVTTVTTNCSYTITGTTPPSISRGTTRTLKANVANAATSAVAITSITLTPPAGGAIATPTTNYAVSIAPNTNADVSITATASCNPAKSAGAWTHSVAGFTPSGTLGTSLGAGACSVAFSPPPSSILDGVPFNLEVKVKDGDGSPIVGFGGNVTLVLVGNDCTLVVPTPAPTTVDGVATFNNIKLSLVKDAGTCTLQAKSTIDGAEFLSTPLTLSVYDATLACTAKLPVLDALNLPPSPIPPTPPTGMFNASEGGATTPQHTGFIYGARGFGDFKGADNCTLINYALYNNIPSANTANIVDPLGNVVPPGFWSFTFDNAAPTTNPVVAIVSTYRPEWGDGATGLPTRVTQICTAVPCPGSPDDYPAAWKLAPACNSTLVLHSSIPANEKGCVAAQKWWSVDASNCTAPPPATPPGVLPRCLRVTTTVIIGEDPVVGRGGAGGV